MQKKLHFSRICCKIAFVPMQRCLSGLRSTIGNRVTGVTRPEVRILFSAPTRERPNGALFSCWRREEAERPSDSRRFARGGGGAWSGGRVETISRRRSFRGAAEENPLKANTGAPQRGAFFVLAQRRGEKTLRFPEVRARRRRSAKREWSRNRFPPTKLSRRSRRKSSKSQHESAPTGRFFRVVNYTIKCNR